MGPFSAARISAQIFGALCGQSATGDFGRPRFRGTVRAHMSSHTQKKDRGRPSPPPPCKSNAKVPNFDGNTTECCSDKAPKDKKG